MTKPRRRNHLRRAWRRTRDGVGEFFADLSFDLVFHLLLGLLLRAVTGVVRLLGRALASPFDGI